MSNEAFCHSLLTAQGSFVRRSTMASGYEKRGFLSLGVWRDLQKVPKGGCPQRNYAEKMISAVDG